MATYTWVMIFCCFFSITQTRRMYNNYQVIRAKPLTQRHVIQLHALEYNEKSCHQLDFWTSARAVRKTVDIMVPPTAKEYVALTLDMIGVPYHVLIDDVNEVIQTQRVSHSSKVAARGSNEDFFMFYHTIDEISTGGASDKKKIWFEGGIHAREWISPATVMYITNKFLEKYTSGSEDEVNFLTKYDIYILFVTNPDGYRWTWDNDRLWRKTRSPNEGSECVGTDPNRNWPFEWGGEGASEEPCSDTYRGSSATSEPEIESVVNFLKKLENLEMFIDFHSYSQLMLYPWGYASDLAPISNEEEVKKLGDATITAIEAVSGREYECGNTVELLYAASGASEDYAYSIGTRFSYVIELPDKGKYGFVLPEEEIIPTGEETYAGVMAAFRYLIEYT
ncbi:carboxypeptidase B-like isoform X2 [Antedon mediterranea]|uniref:carboxypeptidase B-like isoform X2 n=1 Tax=Antedon mediterranea TaxID=105859 RepID=UPI003AF8A491